MQNRLRSRTAWIATLALASFIIRTYTAYDIKDADVLIGLILAAATAFGIFKNPKDPNNY